MVVGALQWSKDTALSEAFHSCNIHMVTPYYHLVFLLQISKGSKMLPLAWMIHAQIPMPLGSSRGCAWVHWSWHCRVTQAGARIPTVFFLVFCLLPWGLAKSIKTSECPYSHGSSPSWPMSQIERWAFPWTKVPVWILCWHSSWKSTLHPGFVGWRTTNRTLFIGKEFMDTLMNWGSRQDSSRLLQQSENTSLFRLVHDQMHEESIYHQRSRVKWLPLDSSTCILKSTVHVDAGRDYLNMWFSESLARLSQLQDVW